MLKRLICAAFVVALVGRKSEIVETKVKTSEIRKSISGEMVTAHFQRYWRFWVATRIPALK